MKVGILNMQYSRHNYGALLQASALESVVRGILPKAEVEHIDARPKSMKTPGLVATIRLLIRSFMGGMLGRNPKMPKFGNYEVFSDFRSQHINLSNRTYYDYPDFKYEQWKYDLVIVGSDQVFRIKFVKSRAGVFFLRFLPEGCRRIAYAASFGVGHWEGEDDPNFTEQISSDLAKFDAISVRESSGVKICRDIFGLEAIQALDPTLLVGRSYFDSIIEKADPTITVSDWSLHFISEDAPFIDLVPKFAEVNRKSFNDIYCAKSRTWPFPAAIHFSSVPEWLMQIRDTKELVLTDSFHCVCFSILFEKNFLVFVSEQKGSERMNSLLSAFGLEDRICRSSEGLEAYARGHSSIDYSFVSEKLLELRKKSMHYLTNALMASAS